MKRVLLTGATGFIGRQCLPLLNARGYEVHAVSSNVHENTDTADYWHHANLLDLQKIKDLMSQVQPTHLLHLAWYITPGKHHSTESFLWVQSSLELLKQFQKNGGQRVVMAGSGFEYNWDYGYCSELTTPKNPNTFYGSCKHALQTLVEAYTQETNLSSAWGRIFFLYGPYENPKRLVSSVICSLLKGEPALCSHGEQIRDFLHVKDAAEALIALFESQVSGPVNIASGQPIALKDIIHKIAEKLARPDLVRLGALPPAANDTPFVVANPSRLMREVGWHPYYDLDHGIEQTIGWWKDHLNRSGAKPIESPSTL